MACLVAEVASVQCLLEESGISEYDANRIYELLEIHISDPDRVTFVASTLIKHHTLLASRGGGGVSRLGSQGGTSSNCVAEDSDSAAEDSDDACFGNSTGETGLEAVTVDSVGNRGVGLTRPTSVGVTTASNTMDEAAGAVSVIDNATVETVAVNVTVELPGAVGPSTLDDSVTEIGMVCVNDHISTMGSDPKNNGPNNKSCLDACYKGTTNGCNGYTKLFATTHELLCSEARRIQEIVPQASFEDILYLLQARQNRKNRFQVVLHKLLSAVLGQNADEDCVPVNEPSPRLFDRLMDPVEDVIVLSDTEEPPCPSKRLTVDLETPKQHNDVMGSGAERDCMLISDYSPKKRRQLQPPIIDLTTCKEHNTENNTGETQFRRGIRTILGTLQVAANGKREVGAHKGTKSEPCPKPDTCYDKFFKDLTGVDPFCKDDDGILSGDISKMSNPADSSKDFTLEYRPYRLQGSNASTSSYTLNIAEEEEEGEEETESDTETDREESIKGDLRQANVFRVMPDPSTLGACALPDPVLAHPGLKHLGRIREMFPDVNVAFLRSRCESLPLHGCTGDLDLNDLALMLLNEPYLPPRPPNLSPTPKQDQAYLVFKDILRDADPDFLQKTYERIGSDQEALKRFIADALENQNYPTYEDYQRRHKDLQLRTEYTEFNIERFLTDFPDPVKHFQGLKDQLASTSDAKRAKRLYLMDRFRAVSSLVILQVLRKRFYNLTLACKDLAAIIKEGRNVRTIERSGHELAAKGWKSLGSIEFLQEVAFVENEAKILDYMKVKDEAKKKAIQEAMAKGEIFTCNCCYADDLLFMDMASCPDGHLFCKDCIRKGAEIQIGLGKNVFPCLMDCKEYFSLVTLEAVLGPPVYAKMAQRRQMEEVMAAGVEGLEVCPFCDFGLIPLPADKVFCCLNPSCMKQSCRLCKGVSHIPLRCNEVELPAEVKARIYIEDRMTEALIRTCWKCSKKFIKSGGCNKMTCTCGAHMCYLCRQPVNDYKHFNGQGGDAVGKCPLYSNNDQIDVNAVVAEAARAKEEVAAQNPALQLKHDPTMILPEARPAAPGTDHDGLGRFHMWDHDEVNLGANGRFHWEDLEDLNDFGVPPPPRQLDPYGRQYFVNDQDHPVQDYRDDFEMGFRIARFGARMQLGPLRPPNVPRVPVRPVRAAWPQPAAIPEPAVVPAPAAIPEPAVVPAPAAMPQRVTPPLRVTIRKPAQANHHNKK